MRHGYTNHTERVPDGVRKSYAGPDARARADAEHLALTRLHGLMPVPPVLAGGDGGSLLTELIPGEHGQDLIDAGHAVEVLAACGSLLRRLHDLDPRLLSVEPEPSRPSDTVIVHGDYGPNNLLLDPTTFAVTALLDWEFSGTGEVITDVAWCEWIVRTHHPSAVVALPAFFAAYGARPPWAARHAAMLERCRWLEAFAARWGGDGSRLWQERAHVTRDWADRPTA